MANIRTEGAGANSQTRRKLLLENQKLRHDASEIIMQIAILREACSELLPVSDDEQALQGTRRTG